jgi:crotonobetainyl-CoA:carnitine CoA-transferase CaiB-like acyl-CoA transferase
MIDQGSLTGIKVIDLSRMLPGPYCSMVLADHGAEVISIEKKEFEHSGLFFRSLYRNKKHMTLDLKTDKGLEILAKLLTNADVLIEGFRPGVMERLGLDYTKVKHINNRLIYCSITGYGQTGDNKNSPGHDVNYLSHSGVLNFFGAKGSAPSIPGVQIADIAGGAQNAVIAILLALYARQSTGMGQYIDISITDGLIGLLHLPIHYSSIEHDNYGSGDSLLSHRYACYNTYETKDGRYVALGALEKKFWEKLCLHLNRPDLIELQYDENKKQEVKHFFIDTFLKKTYAEWVNELEPLDVCCSGVKSISDVMEDSTFAERQMVVTVDSENNVTHKILGVPAKLSETPGSVKNRNISFGGDTEAILNDLGYSTIDIDTFYKENVI